MTVWILLVNDKVTHVFDNLQAAIEARKNYTKKWSLTEIIEQQVLTL